eukprot:3200877-Pyramimonas_sp.AAC.2
MRASIRLPLLHLCPQSSKDGRPQQGKTLSGHMLSTLSRLAPAPGICSLPWHDWLQRSTEIPVPVLSTEHRTASPAVVGAPDL